MPLKKIVNQYEEIAYRELQGLAEEYGYDVNVKMRLADVVPVEGSGISSDLFSFALKSHFDFVVSDPRRDPLFAVEFDGPTHEEARQQARDAKKDEICKRFDLPLLRINTNHLLKKYNKASLLKWVISAWELQKSFYEAQQRGQIPEEEDFDPVFLWHSGKTIEEVHPHWISLKPRLHFKQLEEEGRIPRRYTCGFVFTDENDTYHGLEWIDVEGGKVVFAKSAMRAQQFPLHLGELFHELLTVLLHDKLMDFLKTGEGSVEPSAITDILATYMARYRRAGCHTGPTCVDLSTIKNSGRYF